MAKNSKARRPRFHQSVEEPCVAEMCLHRRVASSCELARAETRRETRFRPQSGVPRRRLRPHTTRPRHAPSTSRLRCAPLITPRILKLRLRYRTNLNRDKNFVSGCRRCVGLHQRMFVGCGVRVICVVKCKLMVYYQLILLYKDKVVFDWAL